jgi:hypothetical protein
MAVVPRSAGAVKRQDVGVFTHAQDLKKRTARRHMRTGQQGWRQEIMIDRDSSSVNQNIRQSQLTHTI